MLHFIIPFCSALIAILISKKVYKDKPKKDQGFQFNYYGLSYRRRLIRTLITIFVLFPLFTWFIYATDMFDAFWGILIIVFSVISSVCQLGYNYYMYKKHEKEF